MSIVLNKFVLKGNTGKMEKIQKIFKPKYIHIAVIILGIIFMSLSIFHTNMWFDESYTIGIVRHSFSEIWNITSYDVHPPFYYFCLHILNLIFGENIIIYRLFSAITIALTAILGYTHIRKDFGEKVGFWFSFLALMLPVSAQYAGEIRMYSLGMLLGTIMCIYAYRIYKKDIHKLTYVFFGLSSLALAYTHYYGVLLAGVINLALFIYFIKNRKERKQDLIKFTITAVLQVVAYLPWLIVFASHLKGTSFWITLTFPGSIYEILTVQYKGNLTFQPIILSTAFYAYLIYMVASTPKEERKPGTLGFIIYIGIILLVLVICGLLHSVILLSRYLLILNGAFMFSIAYFMARDTNKVRMISICLVILTLSAISNCRTIRENYAINNRDFKTYLNENIEDGDIIIYSGAINGAVITTEVSQNHDNTSYFYNKEHWGVHDAYKAFAPYMVIEEDLSKILDDYTGRIWIVENENTHQLYDEIAEKYDVKKLDEKQFIDEYKDYRYTFELIEK